MVIQSDLYSNIQKTNGYDQFVTFVENTNRFMTEAFENSTGTQRADLGEFKKFCLTLNTLALPNLIAPELVITHPMSSISGNLTYLSYVAGSNKGGVEQGRMFNSVWSLGEMDEPRQTYTSQRVVETLTEGQTKLAWAPVLVDTVKFLDETGAVVEADADAVTADGTITAPAGAVKVAYVYDNEIIPQNDLPILNAKLENMPLQAKVRRIAIYYSQIANFQAKTDYGINLDEQLASQAVGELAYEIDSEVVALLAKSAELKEELKWNKTQRVGVSLMEHYAAFAEVIEIAKAIIYRRTQKFSPNYMLIAPEIMPIITFMPGWNAANAGVVNGPYFAGTLNGLKVYVSPMMNNGEFVLGVNGNDLQTSAAVYAPYMPIVPTQLLGYADGGMSQGFSTLYDLKILSKYTTEDGNEYSPLLVKGQVVELAVNP